METQPNHQLKKSGIERRIMAFAIDHYILTVILVLVFLLFLGQNPMDQSTIDKMPKAMMSVLLPGMLLYFAKDIIKGISIGKWVTGIMVRKDDTSKDIPSIGKLLIRNVPILLWPVEFMALIVSKDKKRIGDKMAKTIVVDNPNKPGRLPRILALLGMGIVFFGFITLMAGSMIKNSAAYQVAVSEIEANELVLLQTGGIKGYGMFPTGNVSISNGKGKAELNIKVLGNNKNLKVGAYLTSEPGQDWKVVRLIH